MKVGGKKEGVTHININGYANAWIIDPQKIGNVGVINGSIRLGFQKYYTYGWMISGLTFVLLIIYGVSILIKKQYEKP
jgi:hypothetical protein